MVFNDHLANGPLMMAFWRRNMSAYLLYDYVFPLKMCAFVGQIKLNSQRNSKMLQWSLSYKYIFFCSFSQTHSFFAYSLLHRVSDVMILQQKVSQGRLLAVHSYFWPINCSFPQFGTKKCYICFIVLKLNLKLQLHAGLFFFSGRL